MEIIGTILPGVMVVKTAKHGDHRGFFSETYNKKAFAAFAHAASLNPNYRPAKDGMRRTQGA